jgi:hypothetical protein
MERVKDGETIITKKLKNIRGMLQNVTWKAFSKLRAQLTIQKNFDIINGHHKLKKKQSS